MNWVNPPYNDLNPWLHKAILEKTKGNSSVVLIPVRTSTRYWHELVLPYADDIYFLQGRLTFQGYNKAAPFDCCLLLFLGQQIDFALDGLTIDIGQSTIHIKRFRQYNHHNSHKRYITTATSTDSTISNQTLQEELVHEKRTKILSKEQSQQ